LDWIAAREDWIRSVDGCNFRARNNERNRLSLELLSSETIAVCPMLDARQLVDTMKKILLTTVAMLAFAAPSFAAEPAKTVGQAPPAAAASFYLAQDTATMKCQVVNAQPAAGGTMKVIGAAHTTQASALTALTADKTCK
jgi:hypothetical protein